jgi:hypothetical protein
MSSGYLERHFDPGIKLPRAATRESLERRQVDRISRALAVVTVAYEIPRRLGQDASSAELAEDKKRARRCAHALANALDPWGKSKLKETDEIRREAAQLLWVSFAEAHLSGVKTELAILSTWAVRNDERRWGRSAVVRLENEIRWVDYALR